MKVLDRLATSHAPVVRELLTGHDDVAPVAVGGTWDNRPTWDNWPKTPAPFDNRPTWDNWNKKK